MPGILSLGQDYLSSKVSLRSILCENPWRCLLVVIHVTNGIAYLLSADLSLLKENCTQSALLFKYTLYLPPLLAMV